MSKNPFNSAKKFVTERPALLITMIPTFIIGYRVRNASTLTKASYYVACVIGGVATGAIDRNLAA